MTEDFRSLPVLQVPAALAELHHLTRPGDQVEVRFGELDPPLLTALLEGAGFTLVSGPGSKDADPNNVRINRVLSLPDWLGPNLALVMCGINPSIYSAECGVGFGRPGNRFWPAALEAGIVSVDRDPRHAFEHHGVGMTDLVKRATAKASELSTVEYTAGIARLRLVIGLVAPKVLCVVGLTGWRQAVDRKAVVGLQPEPFVGSTLTYLMPNPSGLNANHQHGHFVEFFRTAHALSHRD